MSGHSKWATIKHKKAKEDAKRGKVFTKLIREITVAAREGGGDLNGNARLRLIVEKAKSVNMPQDNVSRAIKKGCGSLDGGAQYEAATYEGYGPFGIAVMVEVLSDNKNRTVSDLRHLFTKVGGNLAENGAVSWMFEHKGVIRATGALTEDQLIEKLLDYSVDDIRCDDGIYTIISAQQSLDAIKRFLETEGFKVETAQLEWVAKNVVSLDDQSREETVYKFLDALDDLDDVQNVYANLGT
jgi:YebC/PmpR family DNA-binding regulatory protein